MRADVRADGLTLLLLVAVATMAVAAGNPSWWYVMVGAALTAGLLLVLLWQRDAVSTRGVLVLACVCRVALFWLPPVLSDDMYRYVWDGMLQWEGINPFLHRPDDPALVRYAGEPVFEHLNSAGYYTVYPPLSQLIFSVGGAFYAHGWWASYYVIKACMVGLEWAAVLVLSRMVPARALLLYALNPVVLLAVAGQGHTEAAMVFFLVMTVRFVRQGQGGWASAALACAGWVKLYPFVLLPLLWRRFGWQAVWPALLVSAGIVLPYADAAVPSNVALSLDLYVRYFEFNAGPYYAVKEIFRFFTGDDWSKQLGPAFRTMFLATLPVLYVLDWTRRWRVAAAFVVILGAFFALATTVHPWYVLGILALLPLCSAPGWGWYWLSVLSVGTYLLYVDGPYWLFVVLGWGGWFVLGIYAHRERLLHRVQRVRARRKWQHVRSLFPVAAVTGERLQVLDLGAGEGFVGEQVARSLPADVVLVDVAPYNATDLPYVLYDGLRLPFAAQQFDVTMLYFVLHHAEDPGQVLREALRVSSREVVIVESVYEGRWDRRLLEVLDRWANRVRSGGRMRAQEAHLHFRTVPEWLALFEAVGAEVVAFERRGRWIHKQAFFALAPADISVIARKKQDGS